MQQNMPPICQ